MADLLSYDEVADKAYQHDGISSSILDSFTTSYDKVRGIAWDGSNFIGADYGTDKIYLHTGFTSSVSDSFPSPSGYCYGLAFDGINLLSGDFQNETIYKHDGISSSILETCSGVGETDISDLEWDGTNILHCGWVSDKVFKHDGFSSSILDSFSLPDTLPKGIAWDGINLVSTGAGSDWIWKHDGFSSSILNSFASPGSSPSALTFKGVAPPNDPPTAPTALLCEGESTPQSVIDMTPEFSAVFNDPNEGDIANAFEIHVATTEEGLGSPDLWDSGWMAIGVIQGNRCADIEYSGIDLSINNTYYWKIRFRDDDDAEGPWSSVASFATSWFENWQEKQTLNLERRFVYDGVVETERVESFGVISRASDAVISGGTSLVLINTDKYWNKFIADRSNLRRIAKLQLGIGVLNTIARSGIARSGITASNLVSLAPGSTISSGIYLVGQGRWQDVFTGWIDDPEFSETLVTLSLRDKFAGLAEKELGSEESPLNYYSVARNPADLAWSILVTHGGLDSTASSGNIDINYNTWLAWKIACSDVSLSLKARFTGQSIREVIELIRDLTNSDIYVGGDGKIRFFRFLPSAVPGQAYHFNEDRFDEFSVKLDSDKIINYVKVYYDYDPVTEVWAGNYVAQDLDSQQNPPDGYGLSSETIESIIVWHVSSASAGIYAERRILAFGQPLEVVSFRSFMMGMTTEIGDIIRLSYSFLDYLSDYFRVHKIAALDLADGTIRLEAGFFQDFTFVILDLMEYPSNPSAQEAWVSSLSASPAPRLWSRLESSDDVITPQIGVGGSLAGAPAWHPVKFGNGIYPLEGTGALFPTVANDINVNKGTIEFWSILNWERTTYKKNCYFFSFRKYSPIFGSNYIRRSGAIEYQHKVYGVAANKVFYLSFPWVYPGTLDSINVFIKCRGSTSKIKCALYEGFVGGNAALVTNGTTDEETLAGDWDDWVTFSFSTPPTVVADQPYLIAIWSNQPIYLYRIAWTPYGYQYFGTKSAAYNGFPDPLAKNDYVSGYAWPIYAQYDFSIGDRGVYFAWWWIGRQLYAQAYGATAGAQAKVVDWSFIRGSLHHFAVTWDRTGTDIGGGKTLMIKVDNVEVASSLVTWDTSPDISPVLDVAAGRASRQSLVGGEDNIKTYNVCKTDFSDRFIEDPNKLQCYSEPSIKQQGSHSLKIFAQATLSLNGTLTRIVSPTIDLSGLIVIKFEVQASRIGSNFKIAIRDAGEEVITEHTPNILVADTWQTEVWSILGLSDEDKDAIDRMIITIINADSDNTIYIDKIQAFA